MLCLQLLEVFLALSSVSLDYISSNLVSIQNRESRLCLLFFSNILLIFHIQAFFGW